MNFSEQLADPRLEPLSLPRTICLLQFFVLEQNFKIKGIKKYSILYGFCIASAREEQENKLLASSATNVLNDNEQTLSIIKVSYYNSFQNVTEFINNLLEGKSLKSSANTLNIDHNKLNFDANYILSPSEKNRIAIRPIIFNETNSNINRHFFEKNTLNSPYKGVPSFTLIINKLDKTKLLDGEITEEWEVRLKECLNYLSEETTLLFKNKECIRFGNIEIINTQCADVYGNPYVWYNNVRKELQLKHSTVISAKEIEVTILPNPFTIEKDLLVNCYMTNGAQIILDESKIVYHSNNKKLSVFFSAQEEITTVVVSIWTKKESGEYQIWFKNGGSFLRSIGLSMGIVSKVGTVDSAWLKMIEDSNKKTEEAVNKAREISRVSSEKTTTIGGHNLDPWVTADDAFSQLVKSTTIDKSEAAFFPRGWSSITEEYGAISFLNWFKHISDKAKKVVILDPFFDTLGLEFLARTKNPATEFTIITCTQIMSYDDKGKSTFLEKIFRIFIKEKDRKNLEPNRASRIKRFFNAYPSLFTDVECKIYDLRSKGGGDKNLLHDRYILVFEENSSIKGFHLSNSIQGATKNHPLLITVIPRDIIQGVNLYLNGIMKDSENINSIQLYDSTEKQIVGIKEEKEKPNEILLSKIRNVWDEEKEKFTSDFGINKLVIDLSSKDQRTFEKNWITISSFFANSFAFTNLTNILSPLLLPQTTENLICFIKNSLKPNEIYGFNKENFRIKNYLQLFREEFEEGLDFGLRINGYIEESYGYGSWSVYYACKYLFQLNTESYLQLINFLKVEFDKIEVGVDLTQHPLTKLTDIYVNRLLESLFYNDNVDLIQKVISLNVPSFKGISAAAFITIYSAGKSTHDSTFLMDKFRLNLTKEERLITLLFWYKYETQRKKDEAYSEFILLFIKEELLTDYSVERIKLIIIKLETINLIEEKITTKIFNGLVEVGKMTTNEVFHLWFDKFLKLINDKEGFLNKEGLVDVTGWAYCTIDAQLQMEVIKDIEKQIKHLKQTIWKPFHRVTLEWDRSFESLLLFKCLLIIIILYDEKNCVKIAYAATIQKIIDDLESLEISYKPDKLGIAITEYITHIENKRKL